MCLRAFSTVGRRVPNHRSGSTGNQWKANDKKTVRWIFTRQSAIFGWKHILIISKEGATTLFVMFGTLPVSLLWLPFCDNQINMIGSKMSWAWRNWWLLSNHMVRSWIHCWRGAEGAAKEEEGWAQWEGGGGGERGGGGGVSTMCFVGEFC